MMKHYTISKNSWHYRFLYEYKYLLEYGIKNDICNYVRQLTFVSLFLTFVGLFIGSLLILAIWPWYSLTRSLWLGLDYISWTNMRAELLILFIEFTFLGLTLIYHAFCYAVRKIEKRKEGQPYVPYTPGVAKIWWTSFKDKTCVLLEFK